MGGERTEERGKQTLGRVYRDMRQTFGHGFMGEVRKEVARHAQ